MSIQNYKNYDKDIKNINASLDNIIHKQKNKIILVGDSITNLIGNMDYEVTIGSPDSAYFQSSSYFVQANILLRQRLNLVGKYGYSGQKTDYIIAQLPTILLNNPVPDFASVLIGTNDIAQDIDYNIIISNLNTIYNSFIKAGIRVIACTIPPSNNTNSTQKITQYKVNNWIINKAYVDENIIICDWYSTLSNVAGDAYQSNMSTDGVHPLVKGAMLMGKVFSDALEPIIPKIDLLPKSNTDLDNLLLNSLFAVDTNADGFADSWSKYSPGGTFTQSIISRVNTNGNWQGLTMDGTNKNSVFQSVTTGFSVGDKLCAMIEFEVDNAVTNIDSYVLDVYLKNASAVKILDIQANQIPSAQGIRFGTTVMSGILKTPKFTVPANTTSIVISFDSKVTGLIKISKAKLYKVD